jgi:hypothetical protein
MMNMESLLDMDLNVHVQLKDYAIMVNLMDELSIDTEDLLGEVLTQPAKEAMWSVLHKLAQHKVEMLIGDKCEGDLEEALDDREFLATALEAFNHRKSALLRLWNNPQDESVLMEYHNLLNHMGVLRSRTV